MTSNRTRRLMKELTDIENDQISKVTAKPAGSGNDIMHLVGSFLGPPGTPYEGGTYEIDITIPSDYPFRPPVMKFITKIWHPNVSSQTVSCSYEMVAGRR
jgi:ubiquitin-conjugating enzyme (huntingtin interacting protein 2)